MTLTARPDVSAVPLQGGYIAKQCPVLIQNRILFPDLENRTVSPEVQHRMDAGNRFEAEQFERLRVVGEGEPDPDWVVIPSGPRDLAQKLTLKAMTEGVEVIEQAYLPADETGRRTGRPDLLVRHAGGYVPIDVKHHMVLDASETSVLVSDPVDLSPTFAYRLEGRALRRHLGDALQLAHYRRMLEALGFAADSTLAGVLGSEQMVVWYDLTEPTWTTPAKSDGRKRKLRTTLERYDFEFRFRLDIAATALTHLTQPDTPLLVEPMHCGECGGCGYREHCGSTLNTGSGDASLLPDLDYAKWRILRDNGITERSQVAALHYPTARLAEQGVELGVFLEKAAGQPADTPLSLLRPQAKKQLGVLAEAGIDNVGRLHDRVDPTTVSVGGFVAPRIIDARAVVGEHPVYRRPGCDGEDVPRADIEIDVDMESVNEGVYLWGTLLTDHTGSGRFDQGYRPFVGWADMSVRAETKVFARFWKWLIKQQARAAKAGLNLKVYVWHSSAEHTQMRRIATGVGESLAADVETLVRSGSWVDLKVVFERSWVTGGSSSLKVIAPHAGHSWPVEDPGGGYSMVMFDQAVNGSSEERETARQWILDYNRGDVEATRTIREWLSDGGATWPEVIHHR